MKRLMSAKLALLFISAIALMTAGCGGSGGGSGSSSSTGSGSATALKVAEKVSVVDAQEDDGGTVGGSVAPLRLGLSALSVSALPANSDYHTDPSHTYVAERSAEAFGIINEILCYMAQTRYDLMLNQGNYKAQIDVGQCERERDSASSAGKESQDQSSGANMTEYELWTVNSARADNYSPHIVKVWFSEEAGEWDPAQNFEVKVVITEGKSAGNPYGLFTLNFKASSPDGSTTYMTGYLKSEVDSSSGEVFLKFYNDGNFGGSEQFTEKVTLNRSSTGSAGSGSTYGSHTDGYGTETKAYDIAYNDSFFYRSNSSMNVCLDRTNFDVSAWRYGLYHDENHVTPGKRVEVNSGFPIKYVSGSESYHGWAGYYGLWLPDEVLVSNGATVYKQDYSPGGSSDTEYTVFIAGGRLKKHTKKTLALGEIAGVPLHWHTCGQQGCTEFRVIWNGASQTLNKTAEMDQTTWVWKNIDPAQQVVFDTQAWDFNFYSESLGGSGRINLKDPDDPTGAAQITLSNSTNVVFHLEETVYPADSGIPANLACFENCLDPSAINTASPYFANSTWDPGNYGEINQNVAPGSLVAESNYVPYTFNSTTMELQYQTSPVVMTDNTSNEHGTWTGALMEPTTGNFALLACDWDPSKTCTWQAWDKLTVFYTWETGTQQWNRLTALQDGSTFVSFEPPVSVEYTHTWGDATTSKFYLEYNGTGDLHGIPGKCVDMDTGTDTDCWDDSGMKYIRWVPEFSIPSGAPVTDAVTTDTYYVKALEKEERMKAVAESQCTDAGLSITQYPLPDGSDYAAPDIGARPVVDGAPAVIGGVVQ